MLDDRWSDSAEDARSRPEHTARARHAYHLQRLQEKASKTEELPPETSLADDVRNKCLSGWKVISNFTAEMRGRAIWSYLIAFRDSYCNFFNGPQKPLSFALLCCRVLASLLLCISFMLCKGSLLISRIIAVPLLFIISLRQSCNLCSVNYVC